MVSTLGGNAKGCYSRKLLLRLDYVGDGSRATTLDFLAEILIPSIHIVDYWESNHTFRFGCSFPGLRIGVRPYLTLGPIPSVASLRRRIAHVDDQRSRPWCSVRIVRNETGQVAGRSEGVRYLVALSLNSWLLEEASASARALAPGPGAPPRRAGPPHR